MWPALAFAISASLVAFRPAARLLRAPRPVVFLLLLSLGGIVALTLSPRDDAFSPYLSAECFVRIVRPIGFERMLNLGERGLNVVLFIPFGACLGALPRSRTKVGLIAAALALPFVIEGIQYLVPALDRSCSSVDVVDNLTGLALGLVGGFVIGAGIRLAPSGPTKRDDGFDATVGSELDAG
jgi:glycopeptide antibiotics resistance protein